MYNDCFRYGINAGCDINCPVLLDGDCKLAKDENRYLIMQLKLEKIINNINGIL